ncbi:hypothetical protein FHS57_005992 [Runella defluvii]|uniref:Uncharacterized protein n=1 Tax=Runella defluvii TaxID=370973 RepID=A0A7W6ETP4_9BACT|nr:hypothetical protein [Runella defluvii]
MNFLRDKFLTIGVFDKTLVISLSGLGFMGSEMFWSLVTIKLLFSSLLT